MPRLLASEAYAIMIKRMFGEYVNARKFHNMTKELVIKASLYNMFVAMRM
jgi:hypothetical protein